MKSSSGSSNLLSYFFLTALTGQLAVLAQGPLSPPGPPDVTMKSLDQVEARTIVNSSNTPGDSFSSFKITNSGAYYLTGNLTGVSGKHGIVIAAPNVSLDLNGFSLIGVAGSLDGINATNSPALASGLLVRNGTIGGWSGNGLNTQGGAPGAVFSRLLLLTNTLSGLRANGAIISECVALGNTSNAFTNFAILASGSRIVNCVAKTNYNGIQGGNGSVIEGCVSTDNTFGILASDSAVLHCALFNNSGDGMYLFNNNRIVNNLIDGNNKGKGIEVASGSSGNTLDGNTLLNNSSGGITLANANVTNNLVIRNQVHGSGANSYLMGTGNSFGPLINVSGIGDISATNTSSHPWANFQY